MFQEIKLEEVPRLGPNGKIREGVNLFKGVWSQQEHDLFLEAMQLFPNGSWKAVANHVGTRSARQVQTHAQKYHEKVARRLRGLRKDRKRVRRLEHRIDEQMLQISNELQSYREPGKRLRSEANQDVSRAITAGLYIPTSQVEKVSAEKQSPGSHGRVGTEASSNDNLEERSHADVALALLREYIDYLFDAINSSDSEYE